MTDEQKKKYLQTANRRLQAILFNAKTGFDKDLSRHERRVAEQYLLAYNSVKQKLASFLAEYGVPDAKEIKKQFGTYEMWNRANKYNRLKNFQSDLSNTMQQQTQATIRTNTAFLKDTISRAYYTQGFALETSTQIKMGFGLLDDAKIIGAVVNEYNLIKWQKRVAIANTKLVNQLRTDVTQGLIQNEGYVAIARNVRKHFESNVSNNINRIVRTEANRAQNAGNLLAVNKAKEYGKELGVDVINVWLSVKDDKTREQHRDMDGREEERTGKNKGKFVFPDGTVTTAPCQSGVAGHDINCRCTLISKVNNMKPRLMRESNVKNGKAVPYESYNSYYQGRILNKQGFRAPTNVNVQQQVPTVPLVAPAWVQYGTPLPPAQQQVDFNEADVKKLLEQKKEEERNRKTFNTIGEFKDTVKTRFEDALGYRPVGVPTTGELTITDLENRFKQLDKLLDEYELPKEIYGLPKYNYDVSFRSRGGTYGFLQPQENYVGFSEINFGHEIDRRRTKAHKGDYWKKAPVDDSNLEISTLTHEFAHLISISEHAQQQRYTDATGMRTIYIPKNKVVDFWHEIGQIKRQYFKDIKETMKKPMTQEFTDFFENEFIGEYASSDINEFVAESFVNYKLHSKPSKYAVQVGKTIDKYFKKKKRK